MNTIAYDDSGWVEPNIIVQHGGGPWGTLPHISLTAKWVWTSDNALHVYCRLPLCKYKNKLQAVDSPFLSTSSSKAHVSIDHFFLSPDFMNFCSGHKDCLYRD